MHWSSLITSINWVSQLQKPISQSSAPFIIKRPCFAKWYLHYFQDLNLPSNNHVFGAQKERKRQAWLPFLTLDLAMTCCLSGALMSPSYSTPTPHLHRPPMRLKPRRQCQIALFKCVTLEFWGVALPSSSCSDFLTKRVSSQGRQTRQFKQQLPPSDRQKPPWCGGFWAVQQLKISLAHFQPIL